MSDERMEKLKAKRLKYYREHGPLESYRTDRAEENPKEFGETATYPNPKHVLQWDETRKFLQEPDKSKATTWPLRQPKDILSSLWKDTGGLDPAKTEMFLQEIATREAMKNVLAPPAPKIMYPKYPSERGLPVRETHFPITPKDSRGPRAGKGPVARFKRGIGRPNEPEIFYYNAPASQVTPETSRLVGTHELGHLYFPSASKYDKTDLTRGSRRTSFLPGRPRGEEQAHHYYIDRSLAYGDPKNDPYMQAYQASLKAAVEAGDFDWRKPPGHAERVIRDMLTHPYMKFRGTKWLKTGPQRLRKDPEGYERFKEEHLKQNKVVDVFEGQKPGLFTGRKPRVA